MKHGYCLLVCLLLLTGLSARASNFSPFQPGALQQYTKAQGDTTYGLQLRKAGYLDNADSVYWFEPRVGPDRQTPAPAGSCRRTRYRYAETFFGANLRIVHPATFRAEYYLFDGEDQWAFGLKPYAALNQPWPAWPGIMAQVTARAVALVLGQPDSVVAISLSNGQAIRLSKTFGFVAGPAPFDYVWGTRTVHSLVLTALPGRRLGTALLTSQAIYDFQVGDVLCYERVSRDMVAAGPVVTRYAYGDSVLSRTTSRRGDTLTYRIMRHFPAGGGTSGIYSLVINRATNPLLDGATGRFVLTQRLSGQGVWIRDPAPSFRWPASRPVLRLQERIRLCAPDSLGITAPVADGERYFTYSAGLGQTAFREENTTCCSLETSLIGYRKGSEQWGTVFRISRPLPNRPAAAIAPAAISPNPFSQELTVTLAPSRAQVVKVKLLNSLGQVVLETTPQARPAGAQQFVLTTAALPAGLYTVLIQPAHGRLEVVKVLKQQ